MLCRVHMYVLASLLEGARTLKCFASWVSIRAVFPILRCLRVEYPLMYLLHLFIADLWGCHPQLPGREWEKSMSGMMQELLCHVQHHREALRGSMP